MLLFLNILQTVLLILIAASIVYLVYQSRVRTAGNEEVSSFEAVRGYNDVVQVLTMLGKRGEIRKEEPLDFSSRAQDAALVFDGEIAAYIDDIYSRGVKLMSTSELLQGTSVRPWARSATRSRWRTQSSSSGSLTSSQ